VLRRLAADCAASEVRAVSSIGAGSCSVHISHAPYPASGVTAARPWQNHHLGN